MVYEISGKVVKGDGYGRKLGFPTVNLEMGNQELPKVGVYSGVVTLEGVEYRAGIIIDPTRKTEAHLIGYNADAYGKMVILKIKKFLRDYKAFNTEEELIIQIKKDIKLC